MTVFVTCKNEKDPIKNDGAIVLTTLNIDFSDAQGQVTPHCGRIWLKFELIHSARVLTTFSPLLVYGDFSRRSRAAYSAVLGRVWPNFELVRDIMVVFVTCKNEEDPI